MTDNERIAKSDDFPEVVFMGNSITESWAYFHPYLCEMKFSQNELAIDKTYDEKLRDRLGALSRMIGKKNLQLTLVPTYGLKKSLYSNRIQRLITMKDLFKD